MLVQSDDFALCHATVEGGDGMLFQAFGDASTKSVSKMILPHLRRMAETRAKARALRDFTAVGMCSLEELGDNTEEAKPAPAPKRKPRAKKEAAPKPEPKPKAEEPAAPSTEAMVETQPAGKNGKHPSWEKEYKGFIVQVNELGWSYEEVAKLAQEDGHLRPSQMDTAQRRKLLNYLEDKVNRRWDGE
jgi:outer membrane biosynthesis protein TonB